MPWVRLANQGAPIKPTHRPTRVEMTYHSGGLAALAMAVIWVAFFPAMSPARTAKTLPMICPARKPRRA